MNRNLLTGIAALAGTSLGMLAMSRSKPTPGPETRLVIEQARQGGWGFERDYKLKKVVEAITEDPQWVTLDSIFCFGRDGQGGSCRVDNADYQRIVKLTGSSMSFIDSEEDGLEVVALLRRNIPDADFRLVYVTTTKTVV